MATRRLNVRFLAWLLGGLLLFGAGVHLLHGYQVKRNTRALLRQAERELEKKQLDRAAFYLRYYLDYEPGDTDALGKYGETLAQLAVHPPERFRALQVLEKVLARGPEREDLRLRLARLALDLGRYPDAAEHVKILLTYGARKGEIYHLLGRCQEARGKYAQAVASYGLAIQYAPEQFDSYARRAALLMYRLGRPAEVGRMADDLLAANPKSFRAYLARAQYRKSKGLLDEADQDVAAALRLAPAEAEVILTAAELASARGRIDAARAILNRGLELKPQQVAVCQALVTLEKRAGRPAEAVACLRRSLQAAPEATDLRVLLADLLLDGGDATEAPAAIARLRKADAKSALADYLQARLLARERQWNEAADLLERARGRLGAAEWGSRAEDLLGQCYGHLGEPERQLEAARRAVALGPTLARARLALATALLDAGQVEAAVAECQRLLALPDAPPASQLLAARAWLIYTWRLPEAQRDWFEVERLLEEAARVSPDPVKTALVRAEYLAARGRLAEVAGLLDRTRGQFPERVEVWLALADLALVQSGPEGAADVLEQARADRRVGDRPELRLALARCRAATAEPAARATVLALASGLERFTPAEQTRLRRELADFFLRLGEKEAAARLWRQLAERNPRDLPSRFALFELALRGGTLDEAGRRLDELRRAEGAAGALGHYGKAALLERQTAPGDYERLVEARKALAEAARRLPQWSRVSLLAAALDEKAGLVAQAIKHYQQAVERGERQPETVRRVVLLLVERRRFPEAALILRHVEDQALPGDLARLAAEVALAVQDYPRAVAFAAQAVPVATRNHRDGLWLARMLAAAGQPAEAEAVLRRTVDLAAGAPDAWVALVQHLVRTRQQSAAEAVVRRVQHEVPPARRPLTLARCYDALDKADLAELSFREALTARPNDPQVLRYAAEFYRDAGLPQRAEFYLRQLLAQPLKTTPDVAALARRQLALLLTAAEAPHHFSEALELVEHNLRDHPAAVEDRRARAAVLATQPERRREAVKLFESTLRQQPLTPEERFWLARVYEAGGDRGKARAQMLGLLTADGRVAPYLAEHARTLLERGQAEEAQPYLARLEQVEPSTPRTRELLALAGQLRQAAKKVP
jgi:predicted Zn-dependent protease